LWQTNGKLDAEPFLVIDSASGVCLPIGKMPTSTADLHPFSLQLAMNDSLPERIFGSRMSQTGRLPPHADRSEVR
jgi:hypothetical protein